MVKFICRQDEQRIPNKNNDTRVEVASSTLVCETQSKTVTEMAILSPDP
jgi:hypothetical protein